jgi:hypothetical protein
VAEDHTGDAALSCEKSTCWGQRSVRLPVSVHRRSNVLLRLGVLATVAVRGTKSHFTQTTGAQSYINGNSTEVSCQMDDALGAGFVAGQGAGDPIIDGGDLREAWEWAEDAAISI